MHHHSCKTNVFLLVLLLLSSPLPSNPFTPPPHPNLTSARTRTTYNLPSSPTSPDYDGEYDGVVGAFKNVPRILALLLPYSPPSKRVQNIAADVIRLQENIDDRSRDVKGGIERNVRVALMEVERYLLLARMLEVDGEGYYKTVAFMIQSETLG
jgi:hypothetical protein